jgi:hypothetical protein
MKTEIKVTDLEHEDLVNLLSTALYGNNTFAASYDRNIYESLENTIGDCFEDKMADMLLAGHKIAIIDLWADGEIHSKKKFVKFEGDYQNAVYEVGIKDFLKAASSPMGYKLVDDILEGYGDAITGHAFIQMVVFGEEIYVYG